MNFINEKSRCFALSSLTGYALFSAISIAAANCFLGLAVIFLLLHWKNKIGSLFFPSAYKKALLIFFGVFFFLAFLSGDIKEGLLRYLRFCIKLLPLFLALLLLRKEDIGRRIFPALALSLLLMSLYAVWQGLHGDFRAAAFFSHPMYLAGILVQAFPVFFFLCLQVKGKRDKQLLAALLVVFGIALVFNGTRGAWIAIFITLLTGFFLYDKNYKRNAGILFCLLFIMAAVFCKVPALSQRADTMTDLSYQSNSERLLMWQSAWHMFEDHPVLGVGLGQYEDNYREKYISPEAKERGQGHAHNNIMQLLGETGILGAGAFIYMFFRFFATSLQLWLQNRNFPAFLFAMVTLSLMLQGLTETNFGNSVVMHYYYFLMGVFLVSLRDQ